MTFSLTHMRTKSSVTPEMAGQIVRMFSQIINNHREIVLDVLEEHYGSRELPFVLGCNDDELVDPNQHDITAKLPLAVQDLAQELSAGVFVQTIDSILNRMYTIGNSGCDVEEGCKVTWKPSKIPLHLEFRIEFEGEDRHWCFHANMTSITGTDNMLGDAQRALAFVKDNRRKYKREVESDAREKLERLNFPEEAKAEGLQLMRKIAIGERAKNATKTTKDMFADLLALKNDPVDDWARWWSRVSDLSVSANVWDGDLSLFAHFDRFAEERHAKWCKEQRDKLSAQKKSKKKVAQKKRKKDAAAAAQAAKNTAEAGHSDEDAGNAAQLDDTAAGGPFQSSQDVKTAVQSANNAEDAIQPDDNTATDVQPDSNTADVPIDIKQIACLPTDPSGKGKMVVRSDSPSSEQTLIELLENPPPLTPVRRTVSHSDLFNFSAESASTTPTNDRASDEWEDMSDDEPMLELPNKVSTPKRFKDHEQGMYQTWALDHPWFYTTNMAKVDPVMFRTGATPFMMPPPMLPIPALRPQNPLPVFVRRGRVTGNQPKIEYDPVWNRMLVTPHTELTTDIRQLDFHPDWLPPWKLQEYQAVEMASIEVFRHDRGKTKCTMPGCEHLCFDYEFSTQLCLGCGPRSSVRYCSKEHLRQDMDGHWDECGHKEAVMPYWVDKSTQPSRFERRYPAIRDINDWLAFEKHRQRQYFIWNRGQYTLFYDDARGPTVVTWPTVELQDKYGPRVERCMNAGFYDQSLTLVLEHLYCLVRMALRLSGQWRPGTLKLLQQQMVDEFDLQTWQIREEDPCNCAWTGVETKADPCNPDCEEMFARLNLDKPRDGVKAFLEKLEAKSWLLRVWQRQHPTIHNWRTRLTGAGFPGARVHDLDKERPLMGRLWDGGGAPDVCDDWEDIY